MDDIFGGKEFRKSISWPEGLGYTSRLIEEPVQVIEAFYEEDIISEDRIVEFFKTMGIFIKKEIDEIVLGKVIEKDEKNKALAEYATGHSDILPEGMTKNEGDFCKRLSDSMQELSKNNSIDSKDKDNR